MATMVLRTTVAFDAATAARLERLAKRWGVSKSETLRRALENAEAEFQSATQAPDISVMSPLQILGWLKETPMASVSDGWGDDPHQELRDMREHDARIEEERDARNRATPSDPQS